MVLDDEIEQVSRFFLDAGVKILAAECLVNRFQRTLERIVLLVAKQPAEIFPATPQPDLLHRFIVRDSGLRPGARTHHLQALVVVIVQHGQRVAVFFQDRQNALRFGSG